MALETRGLMKQKLFKDVFGGRSNPFSTLCITATGTGLGTKTYKLGQIVLDSSSGKWFLCTAIAGSGTWVKINA
jgi:hypothetical protein